MRALTTIALGALLLGCPGKEPDTCVSAGAQQSFINGARIVAVGGSVDLEVVFPPALVCTSGLPPASRVEVEVADPEGAPITPTVGEVSANPSRGYAVRVAFPVAAVGQHFVRVRLEPSLGVVQAFVEGAVDRTTAAWEPAPEGWVDCEAVVALRDGALGCRRRGSFELSRDGGAAERLEGVVREGGDGLWSLLGGTLRRLERRDGGLALISSVEVDPSGSSRLFDARGDAVLLGRA